MSSILPCYEKRHDSINDEYPFIESCPPVLWSDPSLAPYPMSKKLKAKSYLLYIK